MNSYRCECGHCGRDGLSMAYDYCPFCGSRLQAVDATPPTVPEGSR